MRDSRANDAHAEETRRLILVLEDKNQELAKVLSEDLFGHQGPSEYNQRILAAREAVDAVRVALTAHVTSPRDSIRNYRIVDPKSGRELDAFTSDAEVAPWAASQRMKQSLIKEFNLLEQQPDGSWLHYYA